MQDGEYQVTIILENEYGKVTKNLPMSVFDPSAFSKQMEFDCANYSGSTTLIDFPLLIEMNGSITGFNLRQFASSTGNDLRFFDDSGKSTNTKLKPSTWPPTVWSFGSKYPALQAAQFFPLTGETKVCRNPLPLTQLTEMSGVPAIRSLAYAPHF